MKSYGIIAETDAAESLSVPNLVLKFTVGENSLGAAIASGKIEALKALEEAGLASIKPLILRMTIVEIFEGSLVAFN